MEFKSLFDYTAAELPPNPQFFRPGWIDLCGDWGFAYDDEDTGVDDRWFAREDVFTRTIRVPFPPESLTIRACIGILCLGICTRGFI